MKELNVPYPNSINLKFIACDFLVQYRRHCFPTRISGVSMRLPGAARSSDRAFPMHQTRSSRQQDCSGFAPDSAVDISVYYMVRGAVCQLCRVPVSFDRVILLIRQLRDPRSAVYNLVAAR